MSAKRTLVILILLVFSAASFHGCGSGGILPDFSSPDVQMQSLDVVWDRSNILVWEITLENIGGSDAEITSIKIKLSYSKNFTESFYVSPEHGSFSLGEGDTETYSFTENDVTDPDPSQTEWFPEISWKFQKD